MINVLVINPDGTAEYRDVPAGYPALNQAVFDGGNIQELGCYYKDSEVLFLMDEEGKYKEGLQPNLVATHLWSQMGGAQLLPGDVFTGPVAICGARGERWADIPEPVKALVTWLSEPRLRDRP